MPRIRTIKPEMFADEKLAPLPVLTRFVFVGLISMADDAGRLVDNVKSIDGFLFPESEESSREALDILASLGRINRYTSDSGQRLIQVVNWLKHQKVDKPSKYTLPAPATYARDPRESLAESPRSDLRPTTLDLGPTTPITTDEEGAGGGAGASVSNVTATPAAQRATPVTPANVDPVAAFIAKHDFGPFAPSVEGLCRSARHAPSIIATLQMHIAGEMNHEHAAPHQIGLAAQQMLANNQEFNALLFAGYLREGKKGAERTDNRRRNASETRSIAAVQDMSAVVARQEREGAERLSAFETEHPDRYAELLERAERQVPEKVQGVLRTESVRGVLLSIIRFEQQAAA